MKKKVARLFECMLLLTLCVLFFTGCVRFNTTINIKSNGKMDVSLLYATVDMSEYGGENANLTADEKQQLIDDGWTVEDYSKDSFQGYLISKKDVTKEDLSDSLFENKDIGADTGDFELKREGLKYILDWQVFEKEDMNQISAYKQYFDMSGGYMKMVITLPVKPSESNATTISNDGKTLEWDLLSEGNIHLEFSLINIGIIVAVCAAIILIVAVIVILIIIKKREGNYYQEDESIQLESEKQKEPDLKQTSVADELLKLKKLLDDGIITQEEFDAQKKSILDK